MVFQLFLSMINDIIIEIKVDKMINFYEQNSQVQIICAKLFN